MSGIAGILCRAERRLSGRDAAIGRMLDALFAYGPDAQASWQEGSVALALTVFRSTPEQAHERGPTAFAHVMVVADARLDDREDVLDSLEVPRAEHGLISDSELIARAYVRWGQECVHRLNGDFAFALWDRKENRLFCARDLFAVRPFYYAEVPEGLVFASSFDAFRASGLVKMDVDPVRLHDALSTQWLSFSEVDRTFFREIRRLPAGHLLTHSSGALRVTRFALLTPSREPLPRDSRELPALFRTHFERAVARRLRRVGPAASMLSGGLDSGAVVCMARELLRRRGESPLITCSVLSDPPWDQETPYVRAVQAGGDLLAHDLTMARMGDFTEVMTAHLEQSETVPLDYYVIQLWLACAVTAKQAGARVMFTGEVGDYALGLACDPTLRALREGALWDAVALPLLTAKAYQWRARDMFPRMLHAAGQFVQIDFLRPLSPALYWSRRRRRHARMLRVGRAAPHVRPLPPREWEELLARFHSVRVFAEWPVEGREDHFLAHGVDRLTGTNGDKWARIAGAVGVEVRHPILDRELVQFCMAVPWRERMVAGRSKALLRRSGILPPEHAEQGVMWNANSNARHAMTRVAEAWMSQQLAQAHGVEAWFLPAHIREIRARWEGGQRDGPFVDRALQVAAFSAWNRKRAS